MYDKPLSLRRQDKVFTHNGVCVKGVLLDKIWRCRGCLKFDMRLAMKEKIMCKFFLARNLQFSCVITIISLLQRFDSHFSVQRELLCRYMCVYVCTNYESELNVCTMKNFKHQYLLPRCHAPYLHTLHNTFLPPHLYLSTIPSPLLPSPLLSPPLLSPLSRLPRMLSHYDCCYNGSCCNCNCKF